MSDYPKAYRHPVTEQERTATNVAQEVSLQFDGYRAVELEATPKASEKSETASDSNDTTKSAPKPGPKAQEAK